MRILFTLLTVFLAPSVLHAQGSFSQDQTPDDFASSFYHVSLPDIINSFFLLLLFVVIYFLKRKIFKMEYNLKKHINKPLSANQESYSSFNRIERLESEMKQLRKPKDVLSVEKIKYEEKAVEVELKLPPKPVEEIFFMATPSGERSFDISAKTEFFKATQSLYKFTISTSNSNNATFVFQSDDTGIRDSVNSPHIYIEPVCEPQNALNQNARHITTIQPGKAEKRNDKWIVIDKAQIKYE